VNRKVFGWVVRHLRWCARIPGSPHLFDTFLFLDTAIFHPRRRAAMEALEAEVLQRFDCKLGTHRFGGTAYLIDGHEVAHVHGNGLLDVHLNRDLARTFVAQEHAEPHHVLGDSSWVSYWIQTHDDVPTAMALIEAAAKEGRHPRRPEPRQWLPKS
jgi:Family of unknown function (DUF5519)